MSEEKLSVEEETAKKLLEEKDSESRLRNYSGPMGIIVSVCLCLWTGFQLYYSTAGVISAINLRAFHCIFLLAFTFLLYPSFKSQKRNRKFPPVEDILLMGAGIFSFGYLILHYTEIAQTGGRITDFQAWVAAIALLVVFEASRRTSPNLAILAAVFLAYNFLGKYIPGQLDHSGFTLKRVLITQFWVQESAYLQLIFFFLLFSDLS